MTIRHALTAAAGNTSPATPTDPQFNYVSMLLHGDGTNGAQNNTFVSTPITAPASGYFAGLFDGTGDYLTVAAASAIDLTGTDFTIEAWVYPGTQTNSVDSVFGYGFFTTMLYRNGSTWSWEVGNGSSNFFTLTGTCTQNTWQHVALTRSGNTYTMWVNGVSASTTTNANSPATASRTLAIGVNNSASTTQCFTGYISNFRIVKGTAVYTANFTPPTAPLTAISGTSLLTCMSGFGATFSDLSSNNFTITRFGNAAITGVATTPPGAAPFSASLPGSPSYVTVGGGMPSGAGTAFTMECWIYITDLSSSNIITRGNSGGTFDWGITTSGAIALDNTTVANICSSATGVITANTWYHVAVTRSTGNVYKLWANGTNVATSSAFGTSMTANTTIGYSSFSSSHFFKGRISNFRVATSEVYTANFAPPSAPLTAISGTSLLTFQNATFLDNSPNAYSVTANGSAAITSSNVLPAITRNGNTTQGSLSPYGNLWSNYFDGNGDYLAVPTSANLTLTGDFTFELWIYSTLAGSSTTSNNWFYIAPDMTLEFANNVTGNGLVWYNNSSPWVFDTRANLVNAWHHIAVTRSGTTLRGFLDGVQKWSTTDSQTYDFSNAKFGTRFQGSPTNYWLGYASNFRIVKGTAVYTANFTPSTTPLTAITNTVLLTCQSNRFVDNSANNFAITRTGDVQVTKEAPFLPTAAYSTSVIGGSGYFDGTGDYLSTSSVTFAGDFTVEGWVYINNLSSNRIMVQIGDDSTATGPAFYVTSTGKFNVYASSTIISGVANIVTNTWYHLAVCRSGSTVKSYVNGVLDVTTTNTATFTGLVRVGAEWFGGAVVSSSMMNGYISNLRLVAGTAVYTTNFTPPTAPLTAITNTQLLLNFTNAGIFDNAAENDLETVGSAQISTSVKKYGTGSLAFDGTGGYLSVPMSQGFNFGSGDFTVEFWLYAASVNSVGVCAFPSNSSNYASVLVYGSGTTTLALYSSSAGSSWDVANGVTMGTITANSWNHVAVCRQGTSIRLFVNGVLGNTVTYSGSFTGTYTNSFIGDTPLNSPLNGYIDDVRITKGYARYTANFTPPTAAFPDQ